MVGWSAGSLVCLSICTHCFLTNNIILRDPHCSLSRQRCKSARRAGRANSRAATRRCNLQRSPAGNNISSSQPDRDPRKERRTKPILCSMSCLNSLCCSCCLARAVDVPCQGVRDGQVIMSMKYSVLRSIGPSGTAAPGCNSNTAPAILITADDSPTQKAMNLEKVQPEEDFYQLSKLCERIFL